MKRIYFSILFLFLNLQFSFAQSISINGPNEVEVGVPNFYTFSFTPPDTYPFGATDYKIILWEVSVSYNLGDGNIQGSINNTAQASYIAPLPSGNINIPIQWGNGIGVEQDKLQVRAEIQYIDGVGNFVGPTNNYYETRTVDIKRICSGDIFHGEALDCRKDNLITIEAQNYCSSNTFQWSLSGGSIHSGQGSPLIQVYPPLTGSFTATVEVGRAAANPNYKEIFAQTINRTPREAIVEVIHNNYTAPNFICKNAGQEFAIENNGDIIQVVWNAANAVVSSEELINGMRKVTITPNSSIINGSIMNINATVFYNGGCSTTTQIDPYIVYESETPPSPQGTVYMNPLPYGASVCDAQGYAVVFNSSNPYSNGTTTVSPELLPPHAGNRPTTVTVCYKNKCSGEQTCTSFIASPPAPCFDEKNYYKISVSPNPTTGKVFLKNKNKSEDSEEIINYEIYNENGEVHQNGIFNNNIQSIDFKSGSKPGKYFLRLRSVKEDQTFQIILKN